MINDYDYWANALADPARLRAREFKITSDPQLGFYRTKAGKPVAIWEEDGELVMACDWTEVPERDHDFIWMNCALRPVSEEWYRLVESGKPWPDLDEFLAGIGDNAMAAMDEAEQIDALRDQVATYREIEDDETAARAVSLRARLLELRKIVNDKREELKKPHLKAARDIDEAWMTPVKRAAGAAEALRALIEGWETRKRKIASEEAARRQAEAKGYEATFGEPMPVVPEPKSQIRSGYGKAASVREKRVVTGISDLTMALQRYGYADEVAEVMIRLAQQAVDRGQTDLPGFIVETKALVR